MRNTIAAALFLGMFTTHSAVGQQLVVPRLSPLQTMTELPSEGLLVPAERVSVAFGTLLTVLDRDEDTLLIRFPDGREALVRSAELYDINSDAMVVPKAAETVMERPQLFFWDSALRAEAFLRSGPSNASRPLFQEIRGSRFPDQFPISRSFKVDTQLGRSSILAEGLIPVDARSISALTDTDEDMDRRVSLHVIVDGSPYARDFSQRRLSELSRQIEPSTGLSSTDLKVTQTVILEDGSRTEVTPIPLSGLRQILPTSAAHGESGTGFSAGFVSAIRAVRAEIAASEENGRDHIILLLVGPGLQAAIAEHPSLTRLNTDFAALTEDGSRIALLMASVTPEPSDAPQQVLSALSAGLPRSIVGFDESLTEQLGALYTSLGARGGAGEKIASRCEVTGDLKTLCLASLDPAQLQGLLPHAASQDLEWVGFPLWFIVDGSILRLEERVSSVSIDDSDGHDHSLSQAAAQSLLTQKEQIRALEKDIQTASSDLSKAQDQISALQTEVAVLNSQLVENEQIHRAQERLGQENLRALEVQLAAVEDLAQRYKLEINALTSEVAQKDKEVQLLEEVRASLTQDLNSLTELREKDAREREVLQAGFDELEADILVVSARTYALNQENAELRSRLGDAEGLLANALGERQSIQGELTETLNTLATLQSEQAQSKAELESAQEMIREEREKTLSLEITTKQLTAELERLRRQQVNEEVASAARLQAMENTLSAERAGRTAADQKVEGLAADYAQLDKDYRSLLKKNADWEAERRFLIQSLSEQDARSMADQRTIKDLEEQVSIETQRTAELAQKEDEQTARIRSLEETITAQERELGELNNLLVARMETDEVSEALRVSVEELRSKSALLQTEAARLQAKHTADALRIQALETTAVELDRALTASNAFFQELTSRISLGASRIGLSLPATGSPNGDILATIDSLFNRVVAEIERSTQASAQVEASKQNLRDREAQETDWTEEARILSERISVLEKEKAQLLEQMDVAKGVAQENLQLVEIIKKAEQEWTIREGTLLAEIQALKHAQTATIDTARTEVDGAPSAAEPSAEYSGELALTVPITRPAPRPSDLLTRQSLQTQSSAKPAANRTRTESTPMERVETERPQVPAAALPGSLFVRRQVPQNSATVSSSSGGFFGQD